MYVTLKSWCKTPFQILPLLSKDNDGNEVFDTPVDALCYPEYKTTQVIDRHGVEITSSTRLYIDADISINTACNVFFDGTTYIIHSIAKFYDGPTLSIQVVYI